MRACMFIFNRISPFHQARKQAEADEISRAAALSPVAPLTAPPKVGAHEALATTAAAAGAEKRASTHTARPDDDDADDDDDDA